MQFPLRPHDAAAYHPHMRLGPMMLSFSIAILSGSISLASPTPPPADPALVFKLISQLGDPDPGIRRRAASAITEIGVPARRFLLDAIARDDDPQIAEEAGQLLRTLPWWTPGDSEEVHKLLEGYGTAAVPDRIGLAVQIGDQPFGQAVLLRLLAEEQNEDVCWQIEKKLRVHPTPATYLAARQFDLATSRPSALVLSAYAWMSPLDASPPLSNQPLLELASRLVRLQVSQMRLDRDRGLQCLSKAIELETARPTFDGGELDFAFDELCAEAAEKNDVATAAQLRRQQVPRIGSMRDGYPGPFFQLMAMHAKSGPLAGLAEDLKLGDAYVAQPESLFALGKMHEHTGDALAAEQFYQMGLAGGSLPDTRSRVAVFLAGQGWDDLAERECRVVLARGRGVPDREDVNAHFMLSSLAVHRADESTAGAEILAAIDATHAINAYARMHSLGEIGLQIPRAGRIVTGEDAEALMQVDAAQHLLHAAVAKHDDAAVDRQMAELIRLGRGDTEATLEVVPLLKQKGKTAQAAEFFDAAYQPLQKRIEAGEPNAVLWNDTAWLCSRCGERIAEAVALSERALAAMPENPAFMDTCADAKFNAGKAEDAVRLETRALKYRPGDTFMVGQLERFKRGKSE